MTQEEKAKAYDEALERARIAHKDEDIHLKATLERIFPELKESEDEKIRKELIEHCKNQAKPYIDTGNECPQIQSWISWLEKQGEQKVPVVNFKAKDWYVSKIDGKIRNIYYSVDMVEPKFKVGDWITDGDINLFRIIKIDNGWYYTDDDDRVCFDVVHDYYHLWTIEDAKDGDVLVYNNTATEIIMLFRSWVVDRLSACTHFHIFDNDFKSNNCCDCGNGAHPATKEQRELLFQKMKEAGYEWDADKKELKKIHVIDEGKSEMDYCFTKMMNGEKVSPAWSEEDEEFLRRAINATKDVYPMTANWLKSLKERLKGE